MRQPFGSPPRLLSLVVAVSAGQFLNAGLTPADTGGATVPPAVGDRRPSELQDTGDEAARTHVPRLLIDASKGEGLWWSPQAPPDLDPDRPHQGSPLAAYLRSNSGPVRELPRGMGDMSGELRGVHIAVRAGDTHSHTPSEVEAYRSFVRDGGSLLLLATGRPAHASDPLAGAFGIRFGAATVRATIEHWADHPATQGLQALPFPSGNVVTKWPDQTTLLGWLAKEPGSATRGDLVMGATPFGKGTVVFFGSQQLLQGVGGKLQQPFVERLFTFLAQATTRATGPWQNTHMPISGRAAPEFEEVDRAVIGFMQRIGCQAATVAVSKDGQLVYSRGYGWRDEERAEATQPDTLMRIPGIAKCVTRVAVKQLIRAGAFSLDTKVLSLLEAELQEPADPRWEQVTVGHLLDNSGGWDKAQTLDPMFRTQFIENDLGLGGPATPMDVIKWMLQQPFQFDPGSRSADSNFGFCLLGRVVEKASGVPYAAFVQQHICAPLGIEDIKPARTRAGDRDPREAWYPVDEHALNMEVLDSAGGLIASAPALCAFMQRYWLSGEPRDRTARQRWYCFGGLPGTVAVAEQRDDGTEIAVLFNGRSGNWGSDQALLRDQLDSALGISSREASAIWAAVSAGDVARTTQLLAEGADPNATQPGGATPLHWAAQRGYTEVAELLLEHGAQASVKGPYGNTPLHDAAWQGHVDAARALLAHGADFSVVPNDGGTPLHRAAFRGHAAVVALLLDHGVPPNAQDKAANAPLHYAARNGHTEVARLLLERGADWDLPNREGSTPLSLAQQHGHDGTAQLLRTHAAAP